MITITKAYAAADGSQFASLDAAKMHDIHLLLDKTEPAEIPEVIVRNAGAFIGILKFNPNSKPRKPKADKPAAGKKTASTPAA